MKKLNDDLLNKIKSEIKILLHASRNSMRNRGEDTTKTCFSVVDTWYGEAIGILHGLDLLGYVYSDLLEELKKEVLKEEGFYTDHRCKHCLELYGQDDKTTIENGVEISKLDSKYDTHVRKMPFLRRCKLKLYRLRAKFNVFLQNNKLLWKPPTVAILGMWAFTGAIGLFGHITGQIELSKTGEAESNIVSVIVVICFVSFWGYWFMRIFGEYKEPTDYKLYYSRAILPISFTSPLICIFGLVSGFMVFVMMGQADYFNNLTSTLLLKPKSTFFAAGIILASYTVLGIILNTCSLIIRKIKKY